MVAAVRRGERKTPLKNAAARRITRGALLAASLVLAGCGSRQSTLDPEGPAASKIAELWWVMLAAATVIFGVVLALLLLGLLRRRARGERGATWLVVLGGAAVPAVILVTLFVLMLGTLPATSPASGSTATTMTIDVTARQWFWDIEYRDRGVRSANELHIPVGERVRVRLHSADVIHSFWVPQLNRKADAIPGTTSLLDLEADDEGVYRGQCAEFCGLQHANMSFSVVASSRDEFEQWLGAQAQPPPQATGRLKQGQLVLLGSACVYCHTIAGTNASGRVGPDLTHFGGRRTIGAGLLPNTRGNLGGWILDPQHLKPGNKMPGTDLSGEELQSLIDYLESLK
jgi:cytochrome c oxidase subunit 2